MVNLRIIKSKSKLCIMHSNNFICELFINLRFYILIYIHVTCTFNETLHCRTKEVKAHG